MIKKIESKLEASKVLYNVDIIDYTDDEDEYEYVIDDLKNFLDYCISEINTDNYIVYSSMGGWHGRVEGYEFKRVKSYNDIFWFVSRSEEIFNVIIFNDGTVELMTEHYSGRNSYTFKPLCNMTVKELRGLIPVEDKDYLREQGFKYPRNKAELLDVLNEYVD